MPKPLLALALALAVSLAAAAASATPVVSLVADPTTVHEPTDIRVDLRISGLQAEGITLGGLDLWLSYDPAEFSPVSLQWGGALGDAFDPIQTFTFDDASSPGLWRLFEVSLLSAADLAVRQPADSFSLATLIFHASASVDAGPRFSTISLVPYDPSLPPVGPTSVLSDAAGQDLAFQTDGDGATIKIPEPSGALLAGVALLGLAVAPRRWRQAA